jgi:hypothetical protein
MLFASLSVAHPVWLWYPACWTEGGIKWQGTVVHSQLESAVQVNQLESAVQVNQLESAVQVNQLESAVQVNQLELRA